MKIITPAFAMGINLFLFYSGIVVIPQLMLLAGFPIHLFYILPILLLAGAASYIFQRNYLTIRGKKAFLFNSAISLLLIILCLVFAGSFYDTSFDGNWYHQDAMYLLENGWKPVYKVLEESETSYSQKYLNHFPNSSWVAGAFIYKITGNIECAKGLNLLLLLALIGPAFSLYNKLLKGQSLAAFLLALATAANPILLMNLGNTYADGQVAALFTLALIFGCLQILDTGWVMGFLALLAAAILANLKFTSAAYAFLLVSAGLAYLWHLKAYSIRKIITIGLGWGLFTYGILGFSPYLSNWLRMGHPLYPLSEGRAKFFNPESIYPANFLAKNPVQNFFYSLYAKPVWSRNPEQAQLKTLFGKTPLSSYEVGMPELAAMGPLAAELFTLLLPLFVLAMWRSKKAERNYFLLLIGLVMLTVFINPEAWIMRYVPQFWLVFTLMLLAIFRQSLVQTEKNKFWKISAWVLLLACFANLFLVGKTAVAGAVRHSKTQEAVLQKLKTEATKYEVFHGWTRTFRNRLGAAGIDTSKLVYIPDNDSTSYLIPQSLSARYRPKRP